MGRVIGAALILLGGLLTRQTLLTAARVHCTALREISEALEQMAQEIRLCLTPMPRLLEKARRGAAGEFCGAAAAYLRGGMPLAESWERSAHEVAFDAEEQELLAALGQRLSGDDESVCAALRLTASQLRARCDALQQDRREQERLISALCLCTSFLLMIVLL